jgi:hypothetical protein
MKKGTVENICMSAMTIAGVVGICIVMSGCSGTDGIGDAAKSSLRPVLEALGRYGVDTDIGHISTDQTSDTRTISIKRYRQLEK